MTSALHQSEAAFHDAWAASVDLTQVAVRQAFESPTALENRFILSQMGPLAGRKILDIGAGLGESSVYFALQGAEVTATDLSPGMITAATKLGELNGVRIRGIVTSAEDLRTDPGAFDIVYVANTIHHVGDRRRLFANIHRALRPGGRFFSWDPLAYNPVIEVYRRMATSVRSDDETPLTRKDLALAREFFSDTQHREFWIAALAIFLKYYLIDRVHPNDDRYWKRIFRETDQSLRWWTPLRRFDELLAQTPGIRWLAWNMVMWGTKLS